MMKFHTGVIAMSVFLQFFGSPFLKSTFLFWGLTLCGNQPVSYAIGDDVASMAWSARI